LAPSRHGTFAEHWGPLPSAAESSTHTALPVDMIARHMLPRTHSVPPTHAVPNGGAPAGPQVARTPPFVTVTMHAPLTHTPITSGSQAFSPIHHPHGASSPVVMRHSSPPLHPVPVAISQMLRQREPSTEVVMHWLPGWQLSGAVSVQGAPSASGMS